MNLEVKAYEIRKHAIDAIYSAQSGHPGGSMSEAEILSVLYFDEIKEEDKFVLSKGHSCPALYATLALKGKFDIAELKKFRHKDSFLQGHPVRGKVPGVDMSTGSLGQGLSVMNGMALAAKLDNKDYRVYGILGDGEIEEGQIWEAAMTAAHYNLDNVCVFLDRNGLQIDGETNLVMNSEPVIDKFEAFGWSVIEIDGHDVTEIKGALDAAALIKGKPTMIIANTVKGRGISFMENEAGWHGKAPNDDEYKIAMDELNAKIAELEEAYVSN